MCTSVIYFICSISIMQNVFWSYNNFQCITGRYDHQNCAITEIIINGSEKVDTATKAIFLILGF